MCKKAWGKGELDKEERIKNLLSEKEIRGGTIIMGS